MKTLLLLQTFYKSKIFQNKQVKQARNKSFTALSVLKYTLYQYRGVCVFIYKLTVIGGVEGRGENADNCN